MSPYRVVNGDEFARLIEHMRISVPSSIRESERTLAERDEIIAEAEEEARRIIQEANTRARSMLSDNALVQAAQREAERIVMSSKEQADEHSRSADAYATEVLEELAEKLRIISQQVDNGIRILQEKSPVARE
ncbi:MAG: hypothetical protein H6642_09305 [Caldilineaceae bacterium]|nr:hypothetical protein [Caldilineaceae bacterium]